MRYMEKNKARPSKHRAEDLVLFDWFKHSKKLLKRGLMRPDRVEKFRQLLDEAQRLTRKKVYYYEWRAYRPKCRIRRNRQKNFGQRCSCLDTLDKAV